MPYDATIRWIALGLLALGILWVIAAAIGLRPRAMRLRRAIRRSGSATLVCGGCGHPATSLGSIDTCPECGSVYAGAGLDGRGTASRWSPPLPLVALVLIGVVAISSIELAPWVAGRANLASIGTSHVERVISRRPFLPNKHDPQTGLPPPIAIQIDGDVVRAHHPATSQPSYRTLSGPFAPPASAADVLDAAVTIRLTVGVPWTEANNSWDSQSYPPTQSSSWGFMTGVGSWDAMHAAVPTHVLGVRYNTQRWTLQDPTGRIADRGVGMEAGIESLYAHAGIGGERAHPWSNAEGSKEELGSIIKETLTSGIYHWPDPRLTGAGDGLFRPIGRVDPKTSLHRVHRAAPWGLAAAIATTTLLALLAMLLLALSWRTKRRPTTAPA